MIKKANPITQQAQETDSFEVRELDESWNEQLLEISRLSPVKTKNLHIHFDRSPKIFTISELTSYQNVPLGFFQKHRLIGFTTASYQKRYIRGTITDVIYLGNMHVIEPGTGQIFLKKLVERVAQKVKNRLQVKYMYAYVMQGNKPAVRLAELGVLGSTPCGSITMATLFTLKPVGLNKTYVIRKAGVKDIDPIVSLLSEEFQHQLLAPEMNKEIFLQNLNHRPHLQIDSYHVAIKDNQVVGVCLAWDMTPFKKNRIQFHGFGINALNIAYNMVATATGSPNLPKSGEAFKDITIAEYAVRNRDPKIMEDLLRSIYHEYRNKGYQSVIFGCDTHDPIIQATKPFFSKHIQSRVIIAPLQKDLMATFTPQLSVYADTIQI